MREILRASQEMDALPAADRALASRLALGTVATVGFLDEVLDERIRRPSSVEPRVRDALRVCAFETCYLATPGRAAVSQGVELVRSVAPRAAGMANAVLRRLLVEVRPQIEEARRRVAAGGCGLDDLVLVSGSPRWLVARVAAARGEDAARDLFACQLEPAPTYVAVNLLKSSVPAMREALIAQGLDPQPAPLANSFAIGGISGLAHAPATRRSDIVISDLAAQCVARLACPATDGRLLEIGQGRGTKTLLMASAAVERGVRVELVGVESVASKARLCRDRLAAAGMSGMATCLELDGRMLGGATLPSALDGRFDGVLLDAPCSGTGTMRRHPEIAWSLHEEDVAAQGALPELQLELLQAASTQSSVGGLLLYATCSVLPEEDEGIVSAFLASDRGCAYERVDVDAAYCAPLLGDEAVAFFSERLRAGGAFLSLPKAGAPDGHFCAVLRRRA